MLLAIRSLTHGCPVPDQDEADKVGGTFRQRMLIELLCNKINPGEDDFHQLKNAQSPQYFDEAFNSIMVASRYTRNSTLNDSEMINPPSQTPDDVNTWTQISPSGSQKEITTGINQLSKQPNTVSLGSVVDAETNVDNEEPDESCEQTDIAVNTSGQGMAPLSPESINSGRDSDSSITPSGMIGDSPEQIYPDTTKIFKIILKCLSEAALIS